MTSRTSSRSKRIAIAAAATAALLTPTCLTQAAQAAVPGKSQWLADVSTAMNGGQSYLDSRKAQGGSRLAIVLDIDNTSLETYYSPGTATPDVLQFAKHAKSLGYAVLVATYRTDTQGALRDLTSAGYSIDGVCGQISSDSGPAATKERCRAGYAAAGYTITANVGNRPTDLQGGDYERGFKLPDYDGQLS